MYSTTQLGEFDLSSGLQGSDLSEKLKRLMCQINHPSMQGRVLDLSAVISTELNRLERVTEPAG